MRLNRRLAQLGMMLLGQLVVMSFALADHETRITVFDANGRETSGTLQTISHESLSLLGPPLATWKWLDVACLRFVEHEDKLPREPRGAAIWLANGDRLVARPIGIDDEQLRAAWLQFPESPEFALPLESVRGLSLTLPQARERRDEIASWLLDRRAARDELRLLNGDVLAGEITGWRAESIALKSGGAKLNLPNSDVRDIGFNPELLTLPVPNELCWLVSLRDGSRVTLLASKCRIGSSMLNAAHVSGVTWDFPLAAICELRVLRGRTIYLSDLTPREATHVPFLPGSHKWPMQRDRSVAGQPLRLQGREFPKGLGMHSRSTVTFDLAGKYRAFHAIVGLDDTTVGMGTASCAVDVDGRRVFEHPTLDRQTGPQRLPIIDVTGATSLTLTVDFGELGDSQDHVDWGDAVLLPTSGNEK